MVHGRALETSQEVRATAGNVNAPPPPSIRRKGRVSMDQVPYKPVASTNNNTHAATQIQVMTTAMI